MNIVETINYGYGHLEPVILGLMAMNKNFLLIGRHGAGKSRLAKILSQGYGQQGYVFYDATKDDLISIAGIPNPEAIKTGQLKFTPHQRSIWDKSTVVVDEITRATKENQNLWLEILEERTCFGMPLSYRTLIATANPESYAAAFKLDEALLDRFYAVLPIPDLQENMGVRELSRILSLNMVQRPEIEAETIARVFTEIQAAHRSLLKNGASERITPYISQLFSELLRAERQKEEGQRTYISPRTYARTFPETLLAVAAYYEIAGNSEPLLAAAEDTVKYALATKYKLNTNYVIQLHQTFKNLLKSEGISESEKMRFSLSALSTFEERLAYLQEKGPEVLKTLKKDEVEKFLGTLLQGASKEGEKEKLVHLKKVLDDIGYTGDILRQVDGNLILTLNSAISTFIPILNGLPIKANGKTADVWKKIEAFKTLVAEGKFISMQDEDALKLKAFIIDVYEEDEQADLETVIKLFREIEFND